jgi:RNA polymerase sigma-70 factor (ECF subfamily)
MLVTVAEIETAPSDEALLSRAAAGDRDAFRSLYERHRGMVYHVAFRVTGSAEDAEEIAQETFLTVFREAGSFQGRAKFSTWLTSIALHKSINLAKQRTGRFSLLRRFFGKPKEGERAPEPDEAQAILDRVAPQYRAILTLRYVLGYTYEEIAQTLDCPVGTAKSKLFHAHLAVRKELEEP